MQETLDPISAVSRVVGILRKVTRAAQLLPFLYLLIFAVVSLTEPIMGDALFDLVNALFYVTPAFVVAMLFISRLLKLCVWHKTACLIPMSSQVVNYIDGYVFEFTQQEIIFINTTIGVASIVFFISTIKHFFFNGKE